MRSPRTPVPPVLKRETLGRLTRALWMRYLASITVTLLLLGLVIGNGTVSAGRVADDAALINLLGRERTLGLRMLLMAGTGRTTGLDALTDAFEQSFDLVTARPGPRLAASLGAPLDGTTVEASIRGFIAAARLAAAGDGGAIAAYDLSLIDRLDSLSSAAEHDAATRAGSAAHVQLWVLLTVLGLIALQAVFVYRPGQRAIAAALRELLDGNDRLRRTIEDGEALRREQADFSYAISHDLKSPANTLGLILGEIAHDPATRLGPEARDFMAMGRATVDRMRALVDSVLDYSRATARVRQYQTVPLDEVVDDALADLRADIERRRARIFRQKPLPILIGDPVQVRLLIQNLVSNAIKFTRPHVAPEVSISATGPDLNGRVHLKIADNGIGIAPQDQERIFGLFQRLHLRDAYPGSGIGLALCRRIAANHDGEIRVTSSPGQGTEFDVLLQADIAFLARPAAAAPDAPPTLQGEAA